MMSSFRLLFLSALLVVLTACAPAPTPEEIVAERAQARWNALVSIDFEGSYDFRTPGYRAETTRTEHVVGLSRRKITWISADVLAVDCEPDRCEVEALVGYRADGAPGALSGLENERPVREIWVRIDDQWWYSGPA